MTRIVVISNLGIDGVDLFGGARHSTVTALGRICTPEQIKGATGHTSEAFIRYFQNRQGRALEFMLTIKRQGSIQPIINGSEGGEKCKVLKFSEYMVEAAGVEPANLFNI